MSKPRSRARHLAVQALYQWDMNRSNVAAIESQFLESQDTDGVELSYFHTLLHGVPGNLDVLDAEIAKVIDRAIGSLDTVERAILRLGAFELAQRLDVPYRVVINEYVEAAKVFGGTDGHKYVNASLDRMSKTLREAEVKASAKAKP